MQNSVSSMWHQITDGSIRNLIAHSLQRQCLSFLFPRYMLRGPYSSRLYASQDQSVQELAYALSYFQCLAEKWVRTSSAQRTVPFSDFIARGEPA